MSTKPGRSASLIQALVIAALLGIGWLNFHERFNALEIRVRELEAQSRTLAPLTQVMSGYQPGRALPQSYQAIQATGPPNVAKPGTDDPHAWCPATEDTGSEWLELSYEMPVPAAAVRIHASCNPGAVVRISGGPLDGGLRELWTGTGPEEAVQTIAVTPAVQIQRLRLELDTSKVPGWNQIDAVALVDADGVGHWATAATASSTWGHPREPAPAP